MAEGSNDEHIVASDEAREYALQINIFISDLRADINKRSEDGITWDNLDEAIDDVWATSFEERDVSDAEAMKKITCAEVGDPLLKFLQEKNAENAIHAYDEQKISEVPIIYILNIIQNLARAEGYAEYWRNVEAGSDNLDWSSSLSDTKPEPDKGWNR